MNVPEYLEMKGIRYTIGMQNKNQYAFSNCPFCGDETFKMLISLNMGYAKCVADNCNWNGSWFEFQKALGDKPLRLDSDITFYGEEDEDYNPLSQHMEKISIKLMAYFESLKIPSSLIESDYVAQMNDNVIMFPYYRNNQLVHARYLSTITGELWGESIGAPILYNHQNIGGHTLIITGSEIEVLSLAAYDIESVSIPDKITNQEWIQYEWKWLETFNKIYFIFDKRNFKKDEVHSIAKRLGLWRVYYVTLPGKSVNDCLQNDIPKEKIKWAIDIAKGYNLENLKNPGDFEEVIVKEYHDPKILYGESTGYPSLDRYIRGWRGGEISIWSGRNSSGKTTLLNQIMMKQMFKNIPCCFASMEMPPRRLLRWCILMMELYTSEQNIKKAISRLKHKMKIADIVGMVKPDAIMNIFVFAARKYGVKHFIIDSLMRVSFDPNNELSEQSDFVSKLVNFAMEYDVHVHLVAHPRKSDKDNRRPDKVDVSGTGNITNLAHNVFLLWRFDDEQKRKTEMKTGKKIDTMLMIKKNREWGDEGSIPLVFDSTIKRFSELPEPDSPPSERTDPYKD